MEILKLTPHKRSWILQAIKRFGDFYLSKYGTIDVKQLILRIIEKISTKQKFRYEGPNLPC